MKPGDIVLIQMPQADGKTKKRPGLLLKKMPGYNDWLVCGISTQLHELVKGFDELLDEMHSDFDSSGLKEASIIRLGFLSVIASNKIPGGIGKVSVNTHRKLLKNLTSHLLK